MALLDRYCLPLSTASPAAAAAYIEAVDRFLAAGDNLTAGFEAALAIDPAFALAEIGRARCLATYGHVAAAKSSAVRARTLVAGATRRERQHVEALAMVVDGRGADALGALRAHVAEFARDALALQPATGIFGLIGFSGRLDREAEFLDLMDGLAPHYGDDWWFNSIRAFAEVEGGRVADAEQRVERSLEQVPHNANGAHVRAHVYYEQQRPEAGAQFLRAWLAANSPMALLRGHLAWHLALWELGLGNVEAAWLLYDREFGAPLRGGGPPTPPLNVLTDAASWLWRAELKGEPLRESEWCLLETLAVERFHTAGIPFADIHVAMIHARAGRGDLVAALCGNLSRLGESRPVCAVAQLIARGLAAHARNDFGATIESLHAGLSENVRVGGSHAQRDLVERTLLHACAQARAAGLAQSMVSARPHAATGA